MPGAIGGLVDGEPVTPEPLGPQPAIPDATKRSDLRVRVISAAVMVSVAALAFWSGGRVLAGCITLLGVGIFIEWTKLAFAFERRDLGRALWLLGGAVYIGIAVLAALAMARSQGSVLSPLALTVVLVIAVDVGAYFAGRTFGGPKIAPAISPSKTWSGLGGGILGATIAAWLMAAPLGSAPLGPSLVSALVAGVVTAVVAQSGDFFESWMKRRAGVKDSGSLIPGHGGLFDRADGLIAVLFVPGFISAIVSIGWHR